MATELDNTLDTIMDGLVAPGGPAETVPFTRNGVCPVCCPVMMVLRAGAQTVLPL